MQLATSASAAIIACSQCAMPFQLVLLFPTLSQNRTAYFKLFLYIFKAHYYLTLLLIIKLLFFAKFSEYV